jgi:hypothetical protein
MTQTTTPLRLTSAFEPFTIELIREMEADGWTGRISARGHAIMRAPDGSATCSVSPKVGQPNRRGNLGASYRRWKKAQAEIEAVREAVEDAADDLAWYRAEHARLTHEVTRLAQECAEWQRLAQEAIDLL